MRFSPPHHRHSPPFVSVWFDLLLFCFSGHPDLHCHRFDLMGFGCLLVFCWCLQGVGRWIWLPTVCFVSELGRVSQCWGRCCWWWVIGVGSGVFDPVLWSLGGWSEWGLSSDSGGGFRKEEVTR
jgi:hypothetical protein